MWVLEQGWFGREWLVKHTVKLKVSYCITATPGKTQYIHANDLQDDFFPQKI